MLSLTQEYALRVVYALASHPKDDRVNHEKLSKQAKVPFAYLNKVFKSLRRAGLVEIRRGANGGVRLKKQSHQITLADVIAAIKPMQEYDRCHSAKSNGRKHHCSLHAQLASAQQAAWSVFISKTFQDLASDYKECQLPILARRGRTKQ